MDIPGNIYLCQVDDRVSCGACCGLYNLPDPSAGAVDRLLNERTAAFAGVPREMEPILGFGEAESARLDGRLPYPEFHHCPYLGLIGQEKRKVGCLLHPLADGNRGVDHRGLSYYGSMTCNLYFCPTHHRVPAALKECLKTAIDDWHLYGLIVPETDLLDAFDAQVRQRTGRAAIDPERAGAPELKPYWNALFSLKITWPFARPDRPLVHYFFNDRLYPKPAIDYTGTGRTGSPYDAIFRELHSVFASAEDLARAEAHLEAIFNPLAQNLLA